MITEVKNLSRVMAAEVFSFQESAYDATKGQISLTVIQPGLSKNNRYYSPALLKKSVKIFEGAKMFADHQTDAEAKNRPEGSVKNWVANLNSAWVDESDGSIKATAVVIDPAFKAKLEALHTNKLLPQMGVSIRAVGEAYDGLHEGKNAKIVESLIAARSVDFVTFAGAGGRVEAIESDSPENDIDLVSEAQLRQRRPDLIELVESRKEQTIMAEKTVQEQIVEAVAPLQAKLTALETENATLKANESVAKKAAVQSQLAALLSESKLPEVATARIKKFFETAESIDGMKEMIAAEQDYVKQLSGSVKKHNGASDNANTDESDPAKAKANLVESFKRNFGVDDKQALIMAQ